MNATSPNTHISRVFPYAILDQPPDFVEFGPPDASADVKKHADAATTASAYVCSEDGFVQKGSYGQVVRATACNEHENQTTTKDVALKTLECKTKDDVTAFWKEAKMAQNVQPKERTPSMPSVIRFYDAFQNQDNARLYHLVFEFVESEPPHILYPRLSLSKVRTYMRALLQALLHCHARGIIHGDVKPENVLIDDARELLRLIDFGHSMFYWPEQKYPMFGTPKYRAPEVVFARAEGKVQVHYAVDVWGAGLVLLYMLFPDMAAQLWSGKSNTQMAQLMNVKFGTADVRAFCKHYDLHCYGLPSERPKSWPAFLRYQHRVWCIRNSNDGDNHVVVPALSDNEFKLSNNKGGGESETETETKTMQQDALDLLDKMLTLDPYTRITCQEALAHKFFAADSTNNGNTV